MQKREIMYHYVIVYQNPAYTTFQQFKKLSPKKSIAEDNVSNMNSLN